MEKIVIRATFFTENGGLLMTKLKKVWPEAIFEVRPVEADLASWTKASFEEHVPLLFIGAVGIAVRAIAPFLADKLSDSPVVVIDELGKNVIPILSGHYGGANDISRIIAKRLESNVVITTSTDINNIFAIDVFAKENGLFIHDKNQIKKISSAILAGKKINIKSEIDAEFNGEIPKELQLVKNGVSDIVISEHDNNVFTLTPKRLVIGIGCKKNKDFNSLLDFVLEHYSKEYLKKNLYAIATIDVKENEIGIIKLAQYFGAKLFFYSADELSKVKGHFSESDFVMETVGVSNVCERAAILGAQIDFSGLELKKTANDGMTIAAAKRQKIYLNWQ